MSSAKPPLKGVQSFKGVGPGSIILFDDTHLPVFTMRSRGAWDAGQLEAFYKVRNVAIDQAIKLGQKVFLFSDMSNLVAPDAVLRKQIAELDETYTKQYHGEVLGYALIMSSTVMRGILTAVNWIAGGGKGLPIPTSAVPDLDGAIKDMQKAYQRNNLEPPNFPRDYKFPEFPD
jgi:hypothetical protein